MMTSKFKIFVALSLLSNASLAQTQLSPSHFSHVAEITPADSSAVLVTVRLPQWVYSASAQQLDDLRVFNKDGIVVAHQLSPLIQNQPGHEFSSNAIPLVVGADDPDNSKAFTDIQLDAQGNLAIHQHTGSAKQPRQPIIKQWLLGDAQLSNAPITRFRFELDSRHPANFEANIDIDYSEDLRNWQAVASGQKLVAINSPSGHVEQLAVSIPSSQARYWRIRSATDNLRAIAKIWLTTADSQSMDTESLTISCQIVNSNLANCPIDGGLLPATSVQFNFGQQAVAFNAQIKAYGEAQNPNPIEVIPATLASTQAHKTPLSGHALSHIELTSQTGNLGLASAPTITLQWPAQQLSFLAHGPAPFTLALGATVTGTGQQDIGQNLAKTTATVGPVLKQSAQALPSAPTQTKPKPWLLWSVLGLAVAMLAGMAFKLLQEPKKTP